MHIIENDYAVAVSKVGKDVLSGFLGLEVNSLEQRNLQAPLVNKEVSVIIQVIGQVEGQVICSMSLKTVKQIVGRMMGGMSIHQMDEIGWSAIQEFGNWIVSGIATEFSNNGIIVNITHPMVNEGHATIHSINQYISVSLESEIGTIDIYMHLETV